MNTVLNDTAKHKYILQASHDYAANDKFASSYRNSTSGEYGNTSALALHITWKLNNTTCIVFRKSA